MDEGSLSVILDISTSLLVDSGELFKDILYYSAARTALGKSLTFNDPKVSQIQER